MTGGNKKNIYENSDVDFYVCTNDARLVRKKFENSRKLEIRNCKDNIYGIEDLQPYWEEFKSKIRQ